MRYDVSAMKHTSLHTLGALVARDTRDALIHPLMLVMIAASLLMAWFFGALGTPPWTDEHEGIALWLALTLMIAPVFCGSTVSHVSIAVDRPTGTYLTLAAAGVSGGAIIVSKVVASFVCSFITSAGMLALLHVPVDLAVYFLVLFVPAALPTLVICCILAVLSRNDDKMGPMSLFEVLPAIAPFVGFMIDSVRWAAVFFPTGPAAELFRAACGAPALFPVPVLVALWAFWVAASIAAVVWAGKRFDRELNARLLGEEGVR